MRSFTSIGPVCWYVWDTANSRPAPDIPSANQRPSVRGIEDGERQRVEQQSGRTAQLFNRQQASAQLDVALPLGHEESNS